MNFQSMAYDFLKNKDGITLLNEMSYGYVNKAVYDCPGHWNNQLEYVKGHVWPDEAQAEDFIKYINNTKQ